MTPLNELEAAAILEKLELAFQDPLMKKQHERELQSLITRLSHASYRPAVDFFLRGLDDPNWSWRLDHLTALGFHYKIDPNGEIADKIRSLLLTDENAMVRLLAAGVLPRFSKWPDSTLIYALVHDEEEDVRKNAFESLLELLGIEMKELTTVRTKMARARLAPSIDSLREIAEAMGTPLPDNGCV